MAVSRLLGGNLSRYDQNNQKAVKSPKSAKHNQRKVENRHCDNQIKKSSTEPSRTKNTDLKSRKAGFLDRLPFTFMKPDGNKSNQLDPDKLPKSLSNVAKKGGKAKTAEEARGALKGYFQLLRQSYSREAPPSPKVREQLYNDVVKLSAKVMSFEFTAGKDNDKEKMLGLTAELLQQMQTGLETSSAEFVNSQVTAVLSLGMMTPEDKEFLFASCLNTQIISVDKYTADIENLDRRVSKLNTELAGAKPEDVDGLRGRIKNAGLERDDLVRKHDQLVNKEKGGMHGQKEFFQSCYKIMMDQVRSEIRTGLKKQLNKKSADLGAGLVKSIMDKMDSTLRSKSESIAKNAANEKKGVKAEIVYQQKRTGLFLLLNEEVSVLLGGDKKGSSELKSLPTDKSDSPRSAPARGEEPKGVDLTSVKLDIDDVFLPMNKQAEEWAETLLNRLPDSVRKVVDVEDLARRLTDKALEMDIRDGLILPEGSESPFNRNSVSRKAIRRKKGTEASKPSTSVTEALKEAVVKQEQKIKALAANLHTTADTKKQGVVQELVRFFEDVIEQHRIEAGKGFTGRSSTWL